MCNSLIILNQQLLRSLNKDGKFSKSMEIDFFLNKYLNRMPFHKIKHLSQDKYLKQTLVNSLAYQFTSSY